MGNHEPAGTPSIAISDLISRLAARPLASTEAHDPVVKSAVEFIVERRQDRITTDLVAAAFGMCRRTLERRFRVRLGITFGRALTHTRLYIAQHLLATTTMSMTDVSVGAGFSSPSQMANVFRRELGQSPSENRRHLVTNSKCEMIDALKTEVFICSHTPVVTPAEVSGQPRRTE